ncbi:uncharacterized protein [Rutidosis leptorrhynchoides]|uniref:uncharacterized protein isoform X3 n=1 Tax=Rutidosis leptorrhynchoides TaxID=125765 RepID=UPI003A98EA58
MQLWKLLMLFSFKTLYIRQLQQWGTSILVQATICALSVSTLEAVHPTAYTLGDGRLSSSSEFSILPDHEATMQAPKEAHVDMQCEDKFLFESVVWKDLCKFLLGLFVIIFYHFPS